MALDFLAGCVGGNGNLFQKRKAHIKPFLGAAGVIAGYPLDTVKVKIQTQEMSSGKVMYNGTFDCLAKIVNKEGVRSIIVFKNCLRA